MRILVTGASGQIGGALIRAPQSLGEVFAADRTVLDLAEVDAIAGRLDDVSPDLIVNPAAYTAVDRAESEEALAQRVNGTAPGVIARWAEAHGVPLVHFSTDYVFDGSGERSWREEDTPNPLSAYGRTKLAGEEAVRAAGGLSLVVRTSWIYAATGSNFLRTIARLAQERETLRIVADQVGAPTSAALVASTVWAMLGDDPDGVESRLARLEGTVHLAASGQTSWHGFASEIVAALARSGASLKVKEIVPIATSDYPTPARRPANSRLDLTRLAERCGLRPAEWRAALSPEIEALAASGGAVRDRQK